MSEKNRKKKILLFAVLFIVGSCIIFTTIFMLVKKNSPPAGVPEKPVVSEVQKKEGHGNAETVSSEAGLNSITETNTSEKEWGNTEESSDDELSIYDSEMRFDRKENGEYGVSKIGNLIIEYKVEDAVAGKGTAAGASVDAVTFHDGNEDDLKGYIFAVNAVDGEGELHSLDEAQSSVSEYIPAGSGIKTEWEETEDFFVRRALGYDNESSAAFLFYTIVPKSRYIDTHMYGTIFIMYQGNDGDVIKESSFNSMANPLSDYIPDCEFFKESYNSICSDLNDVLLNRSATGPMLGGLNELSSATSQWYKDVFGVENEEEYNRLSDEEKADLYWQYKDPVGYSQVKKKEGKLVSVEDVSVTEEGEFETDEE